MQRLDLTLEDVHLNLAVDEALLDEAENGGQEVLRLWRFSRPVVVIGRGSKAHGEVDLDFCRQQSIPVLRRCSGGASILAGPGCWMYSVVLSLEQRPLLRNVDSAHQFVMTRLARAVAEQQSAVELCGICDLTIDRKKFSGNSLRIAKNHLLYHGTVLQQVDLELLSKCLRTPPRQPDYRSGRPHDQFVTAIQLDADRLSDSLAEQYGANKQRVAWPEPASRELVSLKYASDAWNLRH